MHIRSDYRFFRQYGGSIVGHDAEGALALARAEVLLTEAVDLEVATVRWEYEEGWTYDDLGDAFTAEEMHAKFQHNEWTGPFVCLVEVGDDVRSLGMIVLGQHGTDDPYARVVAAELARELEDELRQAIGDELDREPYRDCCFAQTWEV